MNTPNLSRFTNPVNDESDEDEEYEREEERGYQDRKNELKEFWIESEERK